MKEHFTEKIKTSLFTLVFMYCISVSGYAQETIRGVVTDNNNSPLPGVSIMIKGTTVGTVTDIDGNYSIKPTSADDIFVFSFIGYATQEIAANGRTTIDVTLAEGVQSLDEVVVIGYGTQRKATLTGAVTSVSPDDVKSSPAVNLTNSLSGLLPGLTALNRSGEPGADNAAILIRGNSTTGNNSPLVVVDGVQNPPGWQRINPNDIEAISVLKDASAAIYGAQAANGVILITTKRGSEGKPTISYSFNQGISQPTRLPKLASSSVFAGYVNEMLVRDGQEPRYTEQEIQKFRDGTDPNYPNTDWLGEVLKDYSLQSMHHLSLRGGSESIRYSLSGSYANQNSIFKKGIHEYKGYTMRSNIDAKVTNSINVNFDLNMGLDDRVQPGASQSPWYYIRALPMEPVYYPNGLPSAGIAYGANPDVMVTDASGNNNNKKNRIIAKVGFDAKIPLIEGLGVDGYFVFSNNHVLNKRWKIPWTVYSYEKQNDEYLPVKGGNFNAPELSQSMNTGVSRFFNFRMTYEKQFEDHYINSFIGAEQNQGTSTYFSAFRKNYISQTLPELFAGDPETQKNNSSSSESARQSLIGRVSYNFQEKYLVDFNARYDGSHKFSEGNRFGFFPGVSVAWVISEEFFKEQPYINNLKLRASAGKIGNDRIDPYQFMSAFNLNSQGYHFGYPTTSQLGIVPGVTPNPNITWEVATTQNIGFDGTLWNGGLGFSVDVFKQRRENILTRRNLEVPQYTGLSLPVENIGIVENKGIELALSHSKRVANTESFGYSVSGNIAYARNNVIDVSEANDVPAYQKKEGNILGAGLYYEALGIFRTQEDVDANPVYPGTQVGHLQYKDVNEDGKISSADKVRMAKSNIPEITFGLNTSMSYKGFSLFANFAGQARAWQYYHQNVRIAINGLEELIANRYTPGSMDSKYPILPDLETKTQPSGIPSTFWLQNAAFVRLKTLELGYTLPESLISKLNLTSVKVYLNGNNLFTVSEIKWFDPEGNNERGQFYPQAKIFNLGVNLSF